MTEQHEHLRLAAKVLVDEVIPAAAAIGAIPAGSGVDEVLANARRHGHGEGVGNTLTDDIVDQFKGTDRVRVILQFLTIRLHFALEDQLADGDEWREIGLWLRIELARLAGFMDGLYRSQADRTKGAVAGRHKVGNRTRDRIAKAVAPYRKAGAFKSTAAAAVASDVAMSYGALTKLLSEMYPGDTWKAPADDAESGS